MYREILPDFGHFYSLIPNNHKVDIPCQSCLPSLLYFCYKNTDSFCIVQNILCSHAAYARNVAISGNHRRHDGAIDQQI